MFTPLFDRLAYANDDNEAIKCRVLDSIGLTWNFEALLIVKYVDDTLVAHHWDRRRQEFGLLVAQVDAVGQAVFMEDLSRSIRSAKRVHRVDTVVPIPAWKGSHEQLIHEATAGDVVVRCNLLEPDFVVSAIMYHSLAVILPTRSWSSSAVHTQVRRTGLPAPELLHLREWPPRWCIPDKDQSRERTEALPPRP